MKIAFYTSSHIYPFYWNFVEKKDVTPEVLEKFLESEKSKILPIIHNKEESYIEKERVWRIYIR